MEKHLIYKHTFPNDKVYIGQCLGETIENAMNRWGKDGIGYKYQKIYRAIMKYGWDNIKHEIIEVVDSQEKANEREIYYIGLYNSTDNSKGYNISIGGSTNNQGKNSHTKEYMREYMRLNGDRYKERHREYNKKYHEEHRTEIKEKYKGKYKYDYKDKYLKTKEYRLKYQKEYYITHKKKKCD